MLCSNNDCLGASGRKPVAAAASSLSHQLEPESKASPQPEIIAAPEKAMHAAESAGPDLKGNADLALQAVAIASRICRSKLIPIHDPSAEEVSVSSAAAALSVLPGVSLIVLQALQEQIRDHGFNMDKMTSREVNGLVHAWQ